MPDMKPRLLLLAGLLTCSVCHASEAETVTLKINPFMRPALEAVTLDSDNTAAGTKPSDAMQLRGTMLAGSNSVANIDGSIIGIGQQLNGYTLVSVEQRHVMLEQSGTQVKLSIDTEVVNND